MHGALVSILLAATPAQQCALQVTKLEAADAFAGAEFGYSVALENGTGIAVAISSERVAVGGARRRRAVSSPGVRMRAAGKPGS